MNFKALQLKQILGALAFGVVLLIGTGGMANAQGHHQRHEQRDLREHQRRERHYYGNSRALREHQRRERHRLEHHQRHERRDRYYNGRRWRY